MQPFDTAPYTAPMLTLFRDGNRRAVLLFETLWGLAMPLVYHATVIPGFLRHLGVPNSVIGLVPALHNGLLALLQPFSTYAIPGSERRVGRMLRAYGLGASGFVLLGLLLFGGLRDTAALLAATLLVVAGFASACGIGDPHYMQVVVDSVPEAQRGRYFGLRMLCLGSGGIAGGAMAALWLRLAAPPLNFAACFVAGGLLYLLSTQSMRLYRERPTSGDALDRAPFRDYVADRLLPQARDPAFRAYLLAIVLFSLAASGFPFLGLLLRERLDETDRLFGVLGALFMAGNLSMSALLGLVCDRWGSRRALALALILYVAGLCGCQLFENRIALLAAYFLAGAWLPGQLVAATDLALRLARRTTAAEATAIILAAMAPARLVGPPVVGALSDLWSYEVALTGCLLAVLFSLAALTRRSATPPGSPP